MNMRRPAMIAIVELHATTSGHGLRKPQFNSNANLQSERPVFRLTHRSIDIDTSSQHPSGHDGADRVSRARRHPMRLTLVLQCVNRGSAGNTKELERFYKEDVKSSRPIPRTTRRSTPRSISASGVPRPARPLTEPKSWTTSLGRLRSRAGVRRSTAGCRRAACSARIRRRARAGLR